MLKKTAVPVLFLVAMKAVDMGIAPIKFGGWLQSFFQRYNPSHSNDYQKTTVGGTAKKENVVKRIQVMMDDYNCHINTAPDYVVPEVKQKVREKVKNSNARKDAVEQDEQQEQTAL
jgi:hypothetical protein